MSKLDRCAVCGEAEEHLIHLMDWVPSGRKVHDFVDPATPFEERLCICGHMRSKHADTLEEPCASDECKLCDCLTFEPLSE